MCFGHVSIWERCVIMWLHSERWGQIPGPGQKSHNGEVTHREGQRQTEAARRKGPRPHGISYSRQGHRVAGLRSTHVLRFQAQPGPSRSKVRGHSGPSQFARVSLSNSSALESRWGMVGSGFCVRPGKRSPRWYPRPGRSDVPTAVQHSFLEASGSSFPGPARLCRLIGSGIRRAPCPSGWLGSGAPW